MYPATWRQVLPIWALCAVAFLIPWPFMYGAWALMALAVITVFTANWPATFEMLRRRKVLWAWIAFFALTGASYFWSEDKSTARWAFESKLAFVLLPIAVGAGKPVGKRNLQLISSAFVLGLALVAMFCLTQAGLNYQRTGKTGHFFYHSLVVGLEANAVYMALYAYIALLLLMSGMALPGRGFLTRLRWGLALLILIFFFLLSARTLLVLFAVFAVPVMLWRQRRQRGGRLHIAIAALLFSVATLALVFTDNPIRKRFADVSKPKAGKAFLPDYRKSDQQFNNLTVRLLMWRVGADVIQTNQLWWKGAGVGDVHHLTNQRMDELGIRDIRNKARRSHLYNVNLHNMYLQTLAALGVVGLLLMLIITFSPLAARIRGAEGAVWLIYSITAILFMMQESALQTQAGIVVFALFTNLLWNRYWEAKNVCPGTDVKPV